MSEQKAFAFRRKRFHKEISEEQEASIEENRRNVRKRRVHERQSSGRNPRETVEFLDKYLKEYDRCMRRTMKQFNQPESSEKEREKIGAVADFLASNLWMPYKRTSENSYSTAVRMLSAQHYAKAKRKIVADSTKQAETEVKRIKAAREKQRVQMEKNRKKMQRAAMDDVDFEAALEEEERALEHNMRALESDGDYDDFDDFDDAFAQDTGDACIANANGRAETDEELLERLAKKYATLNFRTLTARIHRGEMPSTQMEEKTIRLSGLTEKLAKSFYPDGDPFFSKIKSRRASSAPGRKTFKAQCKKTAAEHGSHVHAQLDAFVAWIRKHKVAPVQCGAFLDSLAEPLDACVLKVLSALRACSLIPIATEVVVIDVYTATVTQIDMVAYDLSKEDRISVCAVELKTGYGGVANFKEPTEDDPPMAKVAKEFRDTPYMRAAFQPLFAMMFSAANYNMHFDSGAVVHVSPDPTAPAMVYSLPNRFADPKLRTALYAYFTKCALDTEKKRDRLLRIEAVDPEKRKQKWKSQAASRR